MSRLLVSCLCVFMMAGVIPNAVEGEEIYGGVEIGSKGVKWTTTDTFEERKVKPQDTTDVGLVAAGFNAEAVNYTIQAVNDAIAELKAAGIDDEHISIVASSGVSGNLEKAGEAGASARTALQQAFTGLVFLNYETEAKLMFYGIVPKSEQDDALVIDIGGGNTKWGAIVNGEFVAGEVQMATSTVAKEYLAGPKTTESLNALKSRFLSELKSKASPLLAKKKSFGHVYISGGIVWAMVNFEQPNDFDKEPLVPVVLSSFESFRDHVMQPTITFPPDRPVELEKVQTKILEIMPHETLQAGTILLEGVRESFQLDSAPALIFDRNSLFAWIKGYVEARKSQAELSDPVLQMRLDIQGLRDEVKLAIGAGVEAIKSVKAVDPQVAANIKKGLEEIRDEIKSKPNSAPVVHVDLSEVVEAVREIKAAIEKNHGGSASGGDAGPGQVSPGSSILVDKWRLFQIARTNFDQWRFNEALTQFEEATEVAPSEPTLWYFRGLCELSLRRDDAARISAERCARSLRTQSQLHELYRRLENVQGEHRRAMESMLGQARTTRLAGIRD